MLLKLFFALLSVAIAAAKSMSVTFDGRSFFIDGQRKLFIAGSFHYPRAPRSEWPQIFQLAKASGINLIQTYVFWDIHEPENNVWNFERNPTSNTDLVAFVEEAGKAGLYVHLRIAGYVCAEWNFGGMPVWLRDLNATLRTYDNAWLTELEQFVEMTLSVVKQSNLLASQGGPIIMLQIENEYGNMENYYGENGKKYVQWLSQYALSLDTGGVPWIMCQQGEGVGTAPDAAIVNTCNGFYCDNWIAKHAADFPNQPHMFTENWPGWFQHWGEAIPHRPAVDVAFSVARWFAKGGSYMNYYMAFGGTTFARWVGGPLIVTSYDYDVQINEFAMRAEPKYSLLAQLHTLLLSYSDLMLSQPIPEAIELTKSCESHSYKGTNDCIAFYSNWGESDSCTFTTPAGTSIEVPPWSVSIANGVNCGQLQYNTKISASAIVTNDKIYTPISDFKLTIDSIYQETIPSSVSRVVTSPTPLEQITLTQDKTDYLWYSTTIPNTYTTDQSVTLQFMSGDAGGAYFYIFIDGNYVTMTPNDATTSHVKSQSKTKDTPIRLTFTMPAGSNHRLDILSVSMGLQNYGPYLEKITVGIISDVTLDGKTLSNFTHLIGLVGEPIDNKAVQLNHLKQVSQGSECGRLCWYSTSFMTPKSVKKDTHLALNIADAMGKGMVLVNGYPLGRYWNIIASQSAPCDGCASDTYVGAYDGNKCRTGCGEPSQRYYKLPVEWLHPANSGKANTLVFFEEISGNPGKVQLVEVTMSA